MRCGGGTTVRRYLRIPRDLFPAWPPLWAGSGPTSGWRARGSPTPSSATAATAGRCSATTTRKWPTGAPTNHVPASLGKPPTSLRLDLWTWPFGFKHETGRIGFFVLSFFSIFKKLLPGPHLFYRPSFLPLLRFSGSRRHFISWQVSVSVVGCRPAPMKGFWGPSAEN